MTSLTLVLLQVKHNWLQINKLNNSQLVGKTEKRVDGNMTYLMQLTIFYLAFFFQ